MQLLELEARLQAAVVCSVNRVTLMAGAVPLQHLQHVGYLLGVARL